jgi:hypothetical protein
MLRDDEIRKLEDSLLRIGQEAFAAGHFEVAYHALMAALHCATDEGDATRVRRVGALAEEQRDWIDLHASGHRMSTSSARLRGHSGAYANLVRQAGAVRLLIGRRAEWGQASHAAPETPGQARPPTRVAEHPGAADL